MLFRTRAEGQSLEDVRLADIASLRSEIAHLDADPLLPAERYTGGGGFEGCYTGKIVAHSVEHFALWSRSANRVVILPNSGAAFVPELGSVCCVRAWYRRFRAIVPLTPAYDWLDAFDDFACELQTIGRSLIEDGVRSSMFVLNARGEVRGEYRDIHAANMRNAAKATICHFLEDDRVLVLRGEGLDRPTKGTIQSVDNGRLDVVLDEGPLVVYVPREDVRLLPRDSRI